MEYLNDAEFMEFCIAVDEIIKDLEKFPSGVRAKHDQEADEYGSVNRVANHEHVRMKNGYSGLRNDILANSNFEHLNEEWSSVDE